MDDDVILYAFHSTWERLKSSLSLHSFFEERNPFQLFQMKNRFHVGQLKAFPLLSLLTQVSGCWYGDETIKAYWVIHSCIQTQALFSSESVTEDLSHLVDSGMIFIIIYCSVVFMLISYTCTLAVLIYVNAWWREKMVLQYQRRKVV